MILKLYPTQLNLTYLTPALNFSTILTKWFFFRAIKTNNWQNFEKNTYSMHFPIKFDAIFVIIKLWKNSILFTTSFWVLQSSSCIKQGWQYNILDRKFELQFSFTMQRLIANFHQKFYLFNNSVISDDNLTKIFFKKITRAGAFILEDLQPMFNRHLKAIQCLQFIIHLLQTYTLTNILAW